MMRNRPSQVGLLIREPVARILTPFREFTHTEASGGILLFVATVVALIWANSPWAESYDDLWHATLTIEAGGYGLSKSLSHWINDGLMAIFFFVVGLEIKREVLVGELASLRQAMLPIAAAAGGAILPALIYVAFNLGGEGIRGWGVPMATDIAFALGVLAILGSRVPLGLKVFLTALAIVDDIMAVLVIALFYTAEVTWDYLLLGGGVLLVLIGLNLAQVSRPIVYALFGIVLWLAFVKSGVHATVAGVLLAMTIPARTRIDTDEFLVRSRAILDEFGRAGVHGKNILTNKAHQSALQELEMATEDVESPMQRLEHVLHPWVAFLIVPLFALANAGVELGDNLTEALSSPITLGIVAGLVIGKQVGIVAASFLIVRVGVASLPDRTNWRHIHGASLLAGIGFTMSLFIADLAFIEEDVLALAKVGILGASIIAGVAGWILLRSISARAPES